MYKKTEFVKPLEVVKTLEVVKPKQLDVAPVNNINTITEKNTNTNTNINTNTNTNNTFKASAITISTCTVIAKLNYTVNLNNFTRFVEVHEQYSPELELKSGGIYNSEFYGNCARGETLTDKIKDEFNNQTTVKLKYWGFRNINIKIFANGKLQMTGLKYESEAMEVGKILINIINNTKINILKDINDLIKAKKTFDFQVVYDNNTKNIFYYRKNYNTFLKNYNFNIHDEYKTYLEENVNSNSNSNVSGIGRTRLVSWFTQDL